MHPLYTAVSAIVLAPLVTLVQYFFLSLSRYPKPIDLVYPSVLALAAAGALVAAIIDLDRRRSFGFLVGIVFSVALCAECLWCLKMLWIAGRRILSRSL